ncbi:MAG: hypothetical protein DRG78_02865 [Epsilonproteobacteria bacterium]|nr:MAG: hypothetical protein DRG78_02865 [Campylobacterota bacterium]
MEYEYDEDLDELEELADDSVEWLEEIVDVYTVNGIDFFFDDLIEDFTVFYRYMFHRLGFGEPTEAQLEMAKFLNSPNEQDKMIMALRGLAKSLTTQLYVLWRLLRNNNEKILVRSASSKRSRNFTTFLLNLIKTTPLLQHLAPRSDQRKSTELFDVNGAEPSDSPNVFSAGIGATVTGMRATLIISDDIEVMSNSGTPETRATLNDQFAESINLLVESDAITGETIVLGTPQSADSIYTGLMDSGAFDVFMIPAEYVPLDNWYAGKLAPFVKKRIEEDPSIIGQAVDTRFNQKVLAKRKMRIGKSNYALQYLMNPNLQDELKYPLKLKDLIVHDIDDIDNPIRFIYSSEEQIRRFNHRGFASDYVTKAAWLSDERAKFDFTILAIDPSGRGSDETGYIIVSLMGGKIFVRDFGGLKGGYEDEPLDTLVGIAKKYNVNRVTVESNFGDGAYLKMLEAKLVNVHNCETVDVRATTQKETRIIDTLEPLMNQHRIIVDRRALEKDFDKPTQYSLTYQMTHLTRERNCIPHDDIIDTWELGIRDLVEYMNRGDLVALEKSKEEKAAEVERIMRDGFFGHLTQHKTSGNFGTKY